MQQTSAKEYKITHDWLGKVIHWELCKKLKFDLTIKCYMYKSESIWENETHKLLRDFEIQTMSIDSKKRVCQIVNFAGPTDHRIKEKRVNIWTLLEG